MNEDRREQILRLLRNPIFDVKDVEEKALKTYDEALTHSSYTNEMKDKGEYPCNERLEFLGNFVLSCVISEYLFKESKDACEGDMTRRMAVTSNEMLAETVRKKGIDMVSHLLLGKGELANNLEQKDSIVAGALEALLGAIYLDKGMEKVREIILSLLSEEIKNFDPERNYIDRLQKFAQKKHLSLPEYSEQRLGGPDHSPIFEVTVKISGQVKGKGKGKNISSAKKEAAKSAIENLQKEYSWFFEE